MQTLKIEIEDSLYNNIIQNGIDIQEKFKDFIADLFDDNKALVSTQEAQKRVAKTIDRYQVNPASFSELTDKDWSDIEARLVQRYNRK
jgi:lipoate-protein ligase A